MRWEAITATQSNVRSLSAPLSLLLLLSPSLAASHIPNPFCLATSLHRE